MLFPCDVSFETAKINEKGKEKISVKIIVDQIHRRCPVSIEQTRLMGTGVRIEKQSPWTEIGGNIFKTELIVSLKKGENGEIRVLRDCPKTGTQEETLRIEPR